MRGLSKPNLRNILVKTSAEIEGNYGVGKDINSVTHRRGTIEYALQILRSQYNLEPKRAAEFNRTFNSVTWDKFNTQYAINGGILSGNPAKYVFYGDVVLKAFDDGSRSVNTNLDSWCFQNMNKPNDGYDWVANDTAMGGGATLMRVSTINNVFVSAILINDNGSGDLYSGIKLEGWLIQIN